VSEYYSNVFPELRNIVAFARKSAFWAKKLSVHNIRNMPDFQRLPITTRNEINELYDAGRWHELLTTNRGKDNVIATSGGRPYRSPCVSCFNKQEFEQIASTITDMFLRNGVTSGRIMIVFPGVMPYPPSLARRIWPEKDVNEYESLHISGLLFKRASMRHRLKTFCSGLRLLAYKVSEEEAVMERSRIMNAYLIVKPHFLAVSPNVLRNIFFPELKRLGYCFQDHNTRLLISGGERLLDEDYQQICDLGNPKVILWIESGEIGTIGYSEAFLPSQPRDIFYYTSWRQNFFETVDGEGRSLTFGGRGRIIVTRLKTFLQPLVRYDLEDEGSFSLREGELILGKNIRKL
jgi:phenylacetate-coenzyme A ligase PaaK-like adenylate-forming protein